MTTAHAQVMTSMDPPIQHQQRLSLASTTSSNSSTKHRKSHVGPWRLGRTLGRGSSGRVRLAKHCVTEQLAAIKIVPKVEVEPDPSSLGTNNSNNTSGIPYGIEREVIIMKLIEHPNVMALYDVWENRGELYLVLEYVEGGELFDYLIKRGRLDEKEAVGYFTQIIRGVEYCHSFGICHRDLKPENLLLDRHRNIKIADFGMAALETQGRMLETSCGSPHYASPEIVAGKCYHGAQADIWSCGIILFALLCGHLPFDDDNIRRLLWKVQAGKFEMPRHISPEARDLISRMLKVKPQDRISMREILRHPLVKKYQRHSSVRNSTHHKINSAFANVEQPVKSRSQIDMEIVKNLQTLWHGESKERIISQLLSKENNSEKVFYCLLMKYRQNHSHSQASQQPGYQASRPNSTMVNSTSTITIPMKKRGSRSSLNSLRGNAAANGSFRIRKKRSVSFERPRPASVQITSVAPVSTVKCRPSTMSYADSTYTATTAHTMNATDSVYSSTAVDSIYSDKRASIELASICEAAFGTVGGSSSPSTTSTLTQRVAPAGPRSVSDPVPRGYPAKQETLPLRVASDPTHDNIAALPVPHPPGLSRMQSPAPEEPRTPATNASEFQLPMIFEEPDIDRFTDAIEDFQLPLISNPTHHKEQSKLHIHLIGDSFRNSLCSSAPFTPTDRPVSQFDFENMGIPKDAKFATANRSSVTRVPVPASPLQRLEGQFSDSSSSSKDRVASIGSSRRPKHKIPPSPIPPPHTTPPTMYGMPAHVAKANELSRARSPPDNWRSGAVRTPIVYQQNPAPNTRTPTSSAAKSNTTPVSTVSSPKPTAPTRNTQPVATLMNQQRIPRKPLEPKDVNEIKLVAKPEPKSSLLRKLTRYSPQRNAPEIPPSSKTGTATPIVRTTSGEPKQNWFFKLLNHQFSSTPSRQQPSVPKQKLVMKTLFCNRQPRDACRAMLQVLNSWRQFGISEIRYKSESYVIEAHISSTNVLSLRHARFAVQAIPFKTNGSRLQFTWIKGSKTTLSKFLGQFEKTLADMNLLGILNNNTH